MKKLLVIIFFGLIALYALFQARFVILGPSLVITSPIDNSSTEDRIITVSGTASNVSNLTLDDREIFTDTAGHFAESVAIQKGVNIIKLEAKNKFGRTKQVLVRVVGM